MPTTPFLTVGAALIGALAIIAPVNSPDSARCSVAPFPSGLGPSQAVLLGRASMDTVEAGAGEVAPREGSESAWRGAGPIHGQVVEVMRHAGADSLVLARAFERHGSQRVIIVPWAYDSMCQAIPWTRSAAWVPPLAPGVFTVHLRPESQWADGVPTFDAFMARLDPYPHAVVSRRGYRRTDSIHTTNALTPVEYFELLVALPSYDESRVDPDAAWAKIVDWRTRHPDLAARYPATDILEDIGVSYAHGQRRQALRTVEPAIAGTWRLTFAVNDGPERTFYARTRSAAATWWPSRMAERPDPDDVGWRPEGYHLIAYGALTADSLPVDCDRRAGTVRREGYIAALEPGSGVPAPVRGERVSPEAIACDG